MNNISRLAMLKISPLLEARWPASVYDFYSKGSYTLTLSRINGFFEEASSLAAMIGVFFAPLSFGVLNLGIGKRNRLVTSGGSLMLLLCLAVLLLARSTTAQIVALALLLLALGFSLQGKYSRIKLAGVTGAIVVSVCISLFIPHDPTHIINRMHFQNISGLPRIVTLLDTVDIIVAHPLLGVGRNWYFPHLHNGRRYLAHLQDPELQAWKKQGSGGELSALPALAAQYGLPCVAAGLLVVLNLCLRLVALKRQHPDNALLLFAAPACIAWAALGLTTSLFSLDIRNPLFSLPFFCFYAVSRGAGLDPTRKDVS